MATEQPTADEWRRIEAEVMHLYSPVWLDCDGYLVRLMLGRVGKLRLGITVRVNGTVNTAWFGYGPHAEVTQEGKRFFQERHHSLYRGKNRKAARRVMGKKEAERTFGIRYPWWDSPRSLRRHLVKHNRRIRWLAPIEAREREADLQAQREKELA